MGINVIGKWWREYQAISMFDRYLENDLENPLENGWWKSHGNIPLEYVQMIWNLIGKVMGISIVAWSF